MIVIFCECRFIKLFLWMVCKLVKYFGTVLSIDEMGHQCKFLKDTGLRLLNFRSYYLVSQLFNDNKYLLPFLLNDVLAVYCIMSMR